MNRYDLPDAGANLQPGDRIKIFRAGALGGAGDDASVEVRDLAIGAQGDFFGYVNNNWYPAWGIRGALVGANPAAGTAWFCPLIIKQRATIASVGVRVVNPGGGGATLNIAIYRPGPDLRPLTLVASTGSLDSSLAGFVSGAPSVPSIPRLEPGLYWFGTNTSTGNNSFLAMGAASGSALQPVLELVGDSNPGNMSNSGGFISTIIADVPAAWPATLGVSNNVRFSTSQQGAIGFFKVSNPG